MIPFFQFPPEIRKIVYTTNAIESLNMSLRKAIKTRGAFPSEDAALNVMYLALKNLPENGMQSRDGRRPQPLRHSVGARFHCFGYDCQKQLGYANVESKERFHLHRIEGGLDCIPAIDRGVAAKYFLQHFRIRRHQSPPELTLPLWLNRSPPHFSKQSAV